MSQPATNEVVWHDKTYIFKEGQCWTQGNPLLWQLENMKESSNSKSGQTMKLHTDVKHEAGEARADSKWA